MFEYSILNVFCWVSLLLLLLTTVNVSLQPWTAQWRPVWVTPEMLWPTLPLTRWAHTGSLCWPSSSLACCPRPACDSSPSSSSPCSNRLAPRFQLTVKIKLKPPSSWYTGKETTLLSLYWTFMFVWVRCRKPSGQEPAPGWMTGCSPCVSWSTSRWPTPCWWSTLPCTASTI